MEEKVTYYTKNVIEQKKKELLHIFPEIMVDGKFDIESLKLILGEEVADSRDKFGLYWNGKSDIVFKLIQSPSTGTLVPIKEESIRFDDADHIFIEGENLEVLKLLQKSYFNKIKCIYIDPPYNTGNEFIYPDNYTDNLYDYLVYTGQIDSEGRKTTSNIEKNGRRHTKWLNFMYPRLYLARNLLREDGVIFVSIDDNEVHHLRAVMDSIFGEDNFVSCISVINNPSGRSDRKNIATSHEYLLMYQKTDLFEGFGWPLPEEYINEYKEVDEEGYRFRSVGLRKRGAGARRQDRPNMFYEFYYNKDTGTLSLTRQSEDDIVIIPKLSDGTDGRWRWGRETAAARMNDLIVKLVSGRDEYDVFEKDYLDKYGEKRYKPKSVWDKTEYSSDYGTTLYKKVMGNLIEFQNPKSPYLIKDIIRHATEDGDIILDFFAGSGTTAQAVLELNAEENSKRRFILVQIPEMFDETIVAENGQQFKSIADIAKERIRRVINGYGSEPKPLDAGCKVFKLTMSNYKLWENVEVESEVQETLFNKFEELVEHPLIEGAQLIDVVYENMLKEGFDLNIEIEDLTIGDNKFCLVRENSRIMYITLNNKLEASTIAEFTTEKYKENLLICLDSSITDSDKQNLSSYIRLKTI